VREPSSRRTLRQAFGHARDGLRHAVATQRTFRVQLVLAAAVAAVAVWLGVSSLQAAVVVLAVAGVLAAELFNTAMEVVVDLLVQRHRHDLARVAKDVAASAVVVAAAGAAVAGVLVLGPPLGERVGVDPHAAARGARVLAAAVVAVAAASLLARRSGPSAP
jgi:diacylglycerol kinase